MPPTRMRLGEELLSAVRKGAMGGVAALLSRASSEGGMTAAERDVSADTGVARLYPLSFRFYVHLPFELSVVLFF